MNTTDASAAQPVDLTAGGEDALVLRAHAEVEVRAIPQGAAELLATLADGCSLGEAAAAALQVCPSFDLASHLAALLELGLFVDYRLRPFASGDHHGSDPHTS